MLTPTHVQVAVLRTKDLIFKGKNGTNDAYIVYSLGKEKFQSSVKEKATQLHLDWNEGCDMLIPTSNGNKSELVLKVMHKASLGDKFLGRISLTLSDFDVTGKAKPNWYPLLPKVGSEKDTKYRGEIEVRISFLIKSIPVSTNDLSKVKRSGSFKSSIGSILSLGKGKKKKKEKADSKSKDSLAGGSTDSVGNGSNNNLSSSRLNLNNNLPVINDDPGVISEEEDEHEVPLQFKIDRKSSIQSTTETESIISNSVPSTPKTEPKRRFQEIFTESPPASPRQKVVEPKPPKNNDYYDDDIDSIQNLSPSPKPRMVRLPSVIVEEPPVLSSLTGSNNDNNEPEPPRQTVPGAFATLPRQTSPSKLSVSASMSNLLDPSNNGKGSVRKTIKSMFASTSKHLSVDEIFPQNKNGDEGNVAGPSTKKNSETAQPHLHGGFFMKKRDSLRDLGIPKETYKQYERKSKEELVAVIVSLQATMSGQKQKIGDLEDYIDKLLLRVLDSAPGLLKSGNSIRRAE